MALPPLFKITRGSKSFYIKDENELEDFLIKSSKKSKKNIKKNSTEFKKFIEEEKSKINIQRFKGLGEMNPEELWSTTLNPENRILLRVEYSKGKTEKCPGGQQSKSSEDTKIIDTLMGSEVGPRKDFIINRALEVSNLDI